MTRKKIVLLAFAAALLAAGGWYRYYLATAMPGTLALATTKAPQQAAKTVGGEPVVIVAAGAQQASHIEVFPLVASTIQPELTAYATVLDLQPLFDLHDRLATARAERDSLSAQSTASLAQYQRSRILFNDNHNISEKALQDAQATMRTDQAKLQAADVSQLGLKATLRQQFGDALVRATDKATSPLFRRLLAGRSMIVRVTLPIDSTVVAPAVITIESPAGRRIVAQKLSASPQSDPALQGMSYLYAADAQLPSGTHATAHVASSAAGSTGLLIPENAIVWYGGQAWAYVRTAPDRFTRRFVPSVKTVEQGFIVTTGFRAGDLVVIHGAQLLLSQELTPQGITTQCKDPPECDG